LRGLLGEDFLSRYDVLIDKTHAVLCIDDTGVMLERLTGANTQAVPSPPRPIPAKTTALRSFGQMAPLQMADGSSSRMNTISRNELLAPGKATQAIERARKEILSGHPESAEKEIARALDIAPHFGVAETLRGALDLQGGNLDAAAKWFQQAIDDDPAMGAAYVGMSIILIRQRRFRAALPALDRAEGLLPGVWMIHFLKAWTDIQIGNTQAALGQANIAERFAGADAEKRSASSYLRAMVHIYLNHADTARECLAETIARDPGGELAVLAKKQMEGLQPLLAAAR
jgi:tetratricopeptide (TPR) repeat protein